jgi:hypothetical protein
MTDYQVGLFCKAIETLAKAIVIASAAKTGSSYDFILKTGLEKLK